MLKAFFILGSLLCACIFLPIETTIAVDNQCMCKCDSSHPLSEVDSSTGAGETTMPDEDIGETTEDAFGNDAGDLESSPLEEISNESGSELGATDSLTLFVDQCKSNADCASNQYCLNESHKISCENTSSCDTSAKCVPRRTLGQNCTSDQFCSQALHCWVQAQCVQREKLGEKCEYPRYPKVQSPCEDGLECSSATAKCIATGVRKKGEKCFFDSNQCEQESLFCNDVCETKKLPGAICGFIRGECANGVCANYFGSDVGLNRPYTCVSQPFCTSSLSCPGEMDINVGSNVDAPQVLCNLATGKLYGLCLNETMLTKTLGASCDPAFDTCDARRNLVCDTLNGQPRCLQRDGHCTPGSPFSSCSSKETGVAMECRRPLTQETKKPFGKNACSRKLEIIKLGNLCSLEDYAICEEGASCEMPPGVSVHNPGDCVAQSPGAAESPLCSGRNAKYCMRTIPTGSDCSSVFTTKCEKGSFCINAKCVKSNSEPIVPLQYAGFEQGCETEKPNVCAPGLECGTADFAGQLVCVKPKIVVGENDLCVSNSTHEIVSYHTFPTRDTIASLAI